ncbi:MAG: segregation and condensation protein A [Sphingomonadales bacterium]
MNDEGRFELDDGFVPDGANSSHKLVLDIDGFEGPLDVLLTLARVQKVDLTQISILELVEQYLNFVQEASLMKLELAADYLVMAAWLAYLKSRLLLPEEESEEPSAEELSLRLQLQLQRLEAMRDAGVRIVSRKIMGRDVFARGLPEGIKIRKKSAYDVTLYELLKAYADNRSKGSAESLKIMTRPIYSLEEALRSLEILIGKAIDWTKLVDFLPQKIGDPRYSRSALASTFVAGLELAREGKAEISQMESFGSIYLRKRNRGD